MCAVLIGLSLALSVVIDVHSGCTALASPAVGIIVDGDLSDWPKGLTRYPVALVEYGEAPTDVTDLDASFRVAYAPSRWLSIWR